MPTVESRVVVPVTPEVAFAVSQSTGAARLRWDPFIRAQRFLDGARHPAKGVRTLTRHRSGARMVSRYVSYRPPTNVGMTMESGPWFFRVFAGGWQFRAVPGGTEAVWRYRFETRPALLAPLVDRLGRVVLQRDLDRRISGFARGCEDPVVLAAVADGDAGPPTAT